MKKLVVLLVVLSAWMVQTAAGSEFDYLAESHGLVKTFSAELKAELLEAMERGGPAAAIGVCSEQAPIIASRLARVSGARVARTSLRTRNPLNQPRDWEREVMEKFERRAVAGEAVQDLDYSKSLPDAHTAFVYMKAIPMGGLCAACHGDQISPEVVAVLEAAYPHDVATGFKVGHIRGAFSVTWPK